MRDGFRTRQGREEGEEEEEGGGRKEKEAARGKEEEEEGEEKVVEGDPYTSMKRTLLSIHRRTRSSFSVPPSPISKVYLT